MTFMGTYRRSGRVFGLLALALLPLTAHGQENYHGRKAWTLQNDKLKVIITPGGGHIASLTLRAGRGANLNPLWLPPWPSVEPGQWANTGGKYGDKPGAQLLSSILGHNLCLDFFGAPSAAEIAAGVPVHGEAPCIPWTLGSRSTNQITYSATLPLAQMRVTRTVTLTPGSSAFWIKETVQNLTAFDRPFGWNQHVTLGPPFLAVGESWYDMNATWSQVDPRKFSDNQRLKQGAEFEWPHATGPNGESVDMRDYPPAGKSSDFTASLIPPTEKWAWFTAINKKKGLLIGYLWPRDPWPWAANWEENHVRDGKPWLGKGLARGIEFGTSPFAYSRRDAVTMGKLYDTPTYRWISAKNSQTVGYAAFLASLPEGTTGVQKVALEMNSIVITLDGVDKTIRLPLKH